MDIFCTKKWNRKPLGHVWLLHRAVGAGPGTAWRRCPWVRGGAEASAGNIQQRWWGPAAAKDPTQQGLMQQPAHGEVSQRSGSPQPEWGPWILSEGPRGHKAQSRPGGDHRASGSLSSALRGRRGEGGSRSGDVGRGRAVRPGWVLPGVGGPSVSTWLLLTMAWLFARPGLTYRSRHLSHSRRLYEWLWRVLRRWETGWETGAWVGAGSGPRAAGIL